MSTPRAPICLVEETDFSLLFIRGTIETDTPRIDALQETPLGDNAALTAAARAVFGNSPAEIICAARPKPATFYLANADQARRHAGLAGIRQFIGAHAPFTSLPPAWFVAAQARDGGTPSSHPWLLHLGAASPGAAAAAVLGTLAPKTARTISAPFTLVNALAASVTAPAWLVEIGELASHALLVSRDGVLAAGPVTLNVDRIAEAVQAELGLKFRGSATKLFLNPDYDFTEVGPKIAGQIAAALKNELATLASGHPAPTALLCGGLPSTQQWFGAQLASALGLSPVAGNVRTIGVAFAQSELEAKLSPAWLGALRFIAAAKSETFRPWQPDGQSISVSTSAATAPKPVASVAATPASVPAATAATVSKPAVVAAAVPSPAAAPTPKSASAAAPASVVPQTAKAAAASTTPAKAALTTGASAATPQPAASATPPSAKSSPAPAPTESAVSYPPKPGAGARQSTTPVSKKGGPAPAPTPKKSGSPTSLVAAAHAVADSRVAPSTSAPQPHAPLGATRRSTFGGPLLWVAAALLVVLTAGGYFYLQSQKAAAARLADEKARTEQKLHAEAEKLRLAQQQAEAEAAARKKAEAEAAQKLAAAEAEIKRAENEARTQLAARLANARGTLVIRTQPAGATVRVAGFPARTSPATFADIKIGQYPVTVTLAHHEEAKVELEVKENATTDSGVISLVRLVGSLALNTDPAGAAYELRPANAMLVLPEARRSGKTPAVHDDLPPGDYTVTFSRPGWAPHTETIAVARNATARASWAFPNGTVAITTSPAGVTVTRDGTALGVTPLTLMEPPGGVRYVLTFEGYDPVPLAGTLEAGATLDLNASFAPADRIFSASELDQIPQAISPKQPELPYYLTLEKGRVDLQVTLNADGTPRNVQALTFSNRDLVKFCVAAVEKWKFKPGLKAGKPVVARVVVPVIIAPGKS